MQTYKKGDRYGLIIGVSLPPDGTHNLFVGG